jgi:hypothetical protein
MFPHPTLKLSRAFAHIMSWSGRRPPPKPSDGKRRPTIKHFSTRRNSLGNKGWQEMALHFSDGLSAGG